MYQRRATVGRINFGPKKNLIYKKTHIQSRPNSIRFKTGDFMLKSKKEIIEIMTKQDIPESLEKQLRPIWKN